MEGILGKARLSASTRRGHAIEGERVRERFERLLAAGVSVLSERDLGRVLQEIADVARDVVGARYAALGVVAPDSQALSDFVVSGMTPEQRERIGALPTGRGLLGLVIRERRAIRCADIAQNPQRYGFPPGHPAMRSFLGVPILGRGAVYGNLYLTEKVDADAFDAEDEAIAVLLASLAGVAIENARLTAESRDLLTQLEAMQRQRDLFFAMMNHELRNALTGVFGWSERLLRVAAEVDRRKAATEVYEASERTINLLNNFLDLTRLDAGKLRPLMRELDVATQLDRALAGVRPEAEARGITLEVHCEGRPTLRTDPVRFEQIIVNLVSNAIRYGPLQRPVSVTVEQSPTELRVRVRDCGPGISPEQQARIFEPFERLEQGGSGGSGLGLALARRLAELLGGRLTLQSVPGEGSTFTLALPVSAAVE
jgi:signal transduction histidine kinase